MRVISFVWFIWFVAFRDQMNQRNEIDQTDQMDQTPATRRGILDCKTLKALPQGPYSRRPRMTRTRITTIAMTKRA